MDRNIIISSWVESILVKANKDYLFLTVSEINELCNINEHRHVEEYLDLISDSDQLLLEEHQIQGPSLIFLNNCFCLVIVIRNYYTNQIYPVLITRYMVDGTQHLKYFIESVGSFPILDLSGYV
jgi:hypothetical protein